MAVTVCSSLVNQSNLEKIESFVNDTAYREALESSANYNTRLCLERKMRMPFLDSQTGVAQNHSQLFMSKRQRMPGLTPGQIYSYPRARWRKKRRQYLTLHSRVLARAADSMLDGDGELHSISQVENPALQDTDSKDSQLLKDEGLSKEWYYDESDMLEMEGYDEPDADSDFDYEESYSKRRKGRKGAGKGRGGGGAGVESPSTPSRRGKGGGRGRKKTVHNYEPMAGDTDKPFACERTPGRRGRQPASANQQPPPQQQQQMAPVPPSHGQGAPPPPVQVPQQQQPPPLQPPNLPPQPAAPSVGEEPPMPVLVAEKKTEGGGPETGRNIEAISMPERSKAAPSPYCDFCLGDARENKKTGSSEELVSCSDCGRSGKTAPAEPDKNVSKKSRKKKSV